MLTSRGSTRATIILSILMVVFAATIVQLIIAAFARREAPTYDITPMALSERTFERIRDTVTIDARDETRWTFFDFERRSVVFPPDTASWDLAFRRFDMISAAGVVDLGNTPFDSVSAIPQNGFIATTWEPDTVNVILDDWYDYSFTTHLLTPQDNAFAMQTPESGAVKLQVLSYYCRGMVPGCITLRYEYAPPGETHFTIWKANAAGAGT